MSKRANPLAIGIFMIGAAILAVIGIATFATTTWFDERTTFVSYFEESVNGLEVGAPVKFKGVPVGRVKDLLIRIDMSGRTFQVPAVYEVDLDRLRTEQNTFVDLADEAVLDEQIRAGLRAKLRLESFVTGQLYVELTFVDDPDPVDVIAAESPYPRIPTEPSFLTSLGQEADSLVAGLQRYDISSITENLAGLLIGANEKLDEFDVRQLNASLTAAARSFEELADAPELRTAFREMPEATAQFTRTLEEVRVLSRRLGDVVDPVQTGFTTTNEEVVTTLRALRGATEEMQLLFSPHTGLGYQLEEALKSMSDAADALRRLAQSLEENPDMLIRGKAQPDDQ